jgi:hypothetical protein
MIPPAHSRDVAAAVAGCALAAALTACAAAPAPGVAGPVAGATSLRVMVKLVHGSGDAAAIGAEATRIAGVAASYAAATSTHWHALALHCASAAECDAAVARLRAATTVYQTVEVEGRKSRLAS